MSKDCSGSFAKGYIRLNRMLKGGSRYRHSFPPFSKLV